jgi:hypothetical protein
MAVTAKFTADFTSFYSAVEKAEDVLVDLSKGATKVDAALKRMVDGFSGRKLVQEATLMASAVEAIGGPSKLTASELQAVSAKAAEAADKLKALGQDVPPGIQKLADATKQASVSFSQMATAAAAVSAVVAGTAAAIGKLGQVGADVNDVSDSFKDLTGAAGQSSDVMLGRLKTATLGVISDFELMKTVNLGMSQGLKLTADQFGTVGDVAAVLADRTGGDLKTAFDTLTQAMATGQDRTLKTIGLNIDAEKATKAYAESIHKKVSELTEDEKKQAISNAILEEGRRILEQSGKAQVDFADKVGQSGAKIANFVNDISSWIATSPGIANWTSAITAASSSIAALGLAVGPISAGISKLLPLLGLTGATGAFVGFGAAANAAGAALLGALPHLLAIAAAVWAVSKALEAGMLAWNNYKRAQETAATNANTFAQNQKTLIDINTKYGQSFTNLSDAVAFMNARIRGATEDEKLLAAVMTAGAQAAEDAKNMTVGLGEADKKAEAAAKQHAEAVQNLVDKLGGGEAIAAAKLWMEALPKIGGLSKLTAADHANLSKVLDEAIAAYKRMGAEAPLAMQKLADAAKLPLASTNLLVNVIGKGPSSLSGALMNLKESVLPSFIAEIQLGTGAVDGFGRVTYTQAIPSLGDLGKGVIDVEGKVNKFAESLKTFPQILIKAFTGGGGIKGAINALGAQVGSDLFSEGGAFGKAAKSATGGLTKLFGSTVGGALGAAIPGIGALIGPAFEKLAGWIGSLFGNKTKDAIVDSFGSYDALRQKLNALGEEGERMWIRLTQQTGRNDLASTKAQLEEINKALGLQAAAMGTVEETAKKYGLTLEELGPAWARQELDKKAQELFKDYEILISAGADHVKVLEKMSGSVNEYVNNALKMGTEVPMAMKPMLEEMIKNGQLLDANGNKFTDLESAGIKFSMTMTEGFKSLVAEVQKLTEVIARGLGVSLDRAKDKGEAAGSAIEESFDRATDAANDLADAVDGVTYGSSPGGLKDIIAFAEMAGDALRESFGDATRDLDDVLDRVNSVSRAIDKIPKGGISIGDPGNKPGGRRRDTPPEGGISPDGPGNLPRERRPRAPRDRRPRDRDDGVEKLLKAIETAIEKLPFKTLIEEVKQLPKESAKEIAKALKIKGYVGGTQGKYVNFGSGALAMLHGKERVMTEGEDRGGGDGDWGALRAEMVALRADMVRRDQLLPKWIRDAVMLSAS